MSPSRGLASSSDTAGGKSISTLSSVEADRDTSIMAEESSFDSSPVVAMVVLSVFHQRPLDLCFQHDAPDALCPNSPKRLRRGRMM